jgi:hypothetical protein
MRAASCGIENQWKKWIMDDNRCQEQKETETGVETRTVDSRSLQVEQQTVSMYG